MDSSSALSIQNSTIIWLTIDNHDTNSIAQLQRIINTSRIFAEVNKCIEYIDEIKAKTVFMIIDYTFESELISLIDELPQVDSIYLLTSEETELHRNSLKSRKIKGTLNNIESICNLIKGNIQRWNDTELSISSISSTDISSDDLNRLDRSFMYSQLIKEILLDIEYKDKAKTEFTKYCRHVQSCDGTRNVSPVIDEFEQSYDEHSPVWWYTRGCFIYGMLNKALRDQDTKTLIKMGFFLRDVHQRVKDLHSEQSLNGLTVYRGQGMDKDEFEKKILNNQGGLLSFNNFLSTSSEYIVSKGFADAIGEDQRLLGILFQIDIDQTISSTPFARLQKKDSQFDSEEEILFSMHTIFRIDEVAEINDRLRYVQLKLTSDQDQELLCLTKKIRAEIRGNSAWYRLSHLLGKMANFTEATEVLLQLLNTIPENNWIFRSATYHQLGVMQRETGKYDVALKFYDVALKCLYKISPIDHQSIGITFNDIGEIHREKGNNLEALKYYQQTLNHFEKPSNIEPWQFVTLYSNIGQVFRSMGDYSTALGFFRKALPILKTNLPSNDPLFAVIYNNIGAVYDDKGDDSHAILFYGITLQIEQRSLPDKHPSLAVTHNNLGNVYRKIGNYQKAFEKFDQSIRIANESNRSNHPSTAGTYVNLGNTYISSDGDYSTALLFYEEARMIFENKCAPNNPDLATVYYQIGDAYWMKREYLTALDFLQKALLIQENNILCGHLSISRTCASMAKVFYDLQDYQQAFQHLKRAIQIAYQDQTPAGAELHKIYRDMRISMPQLNLFRQ